MWVPTCKSSVAPAALFSCAPAAAVQSRLSASLLQERQGSTTAHYRVGQRYWWNRALWKRVTHEITEGVLLICNTGNISSCIVCCLHNQSLRGTCKQIWCKWKADTAAQRFTVFAWKTRTSFTPRGLILYYLILCLYLCLRCTFLRRWWQLVNKDDVLQLKI